MASKAFRSPPVLTAVPGHRLVPFALFASLALLSACASGRASAPTTPSPAAPIKLERAILLGEELRPVDDGLLGHVDYDLPIEANSWVESELAYLLGERKDLIDSWIERGDFYRDFIHQVLEENGLPTDLFHMAMIESGFVPTARSHAGAAGMWQFMPATAGDVGLRVDRLVDERLDPIRSTRAAARHLKSLYRIHGDWALAAAAYNAGSGRISRGLVEFSAGDFWELAQHGDLAEETRQYVPRLYAVTILSRSRDRFGLGTSDGQARLAFDSIYVDYEVPLSALAALGGTTSDELERLNPHLLRGSTPPGGYWVWVPGGEGPQLQRAYLASNIRAEHGLGTYTVRWGDTLSRIAQLSDVSSSRLRELNPDIDFDRLMAGSDIRLPSVTAEQLASRPERVEEPSRDSGDQLVGQLVAVTSGAGDADGTIDGESHRVEPGENLWGIARSYGVSVEALQQANGLSDSVIVPGQRLAIPEGESDDGGSVEEAAIVEHRVEWGDTLWDIARQYGSTIEAIQLANGLGDRAIQPGQVLTVPR